MKRSRSRRSGRRGDILLADGGDGARAGPAGSTPSDRPPRIRAWNVAIVAGLLTAGALGLAILDLRDRSGFAEEAVPFRQALTLWGWGDHPATANPHFFSYPSLSIYWYWLLQSAAGIVGIAIGRYGRFADAGVEVALAPHYMVFAARVGAMIVLLLTAWCAYRWSGRESSWHGALVALSVCASLPLLRSVIQLPPEGLMALFGLLGLHALRPVRAIGLRRAWGVGMIAGVLCGTKYSAIPFLVFCMLAAWFRARCSQHSVKVVLAIPVAASLAFLVTTPFAVLAPHEFARDVAYELDHLAGGHLGGFGMSTAISHGRQLVTGIGPALVISVLGFMIAPPLRPAGAGLLLGAACSFIVPAMFSRSGGPERYILPAVPMLAVFTWEITWAALRATSLRLRTLGILLLFLGVIQLGVAIHRQARSVAPSAVACASEWIRRNTKVTDVIVQEAGSIAVFGVDDQAALLRSRCFARASAPWREKAAEARPYSLITVPFVASGQLFADVRLSDGRPRRVVVFDPGWNVVPAMYSALNEVGVQYTIRNSSIRSRLSAALGPVVAQGRWPPREGTVRCTCREPQGGLMGDGEVSVCAGDLAPRLESALGRGWWLRDAKAPDAVGGALDSVAYEVATAQVYEERVRPFLLSLAQAAVRRGDAGALTRAARLLLVSNDGDVLAVRFALLGLSDRPVGAVWDGSGRSLMQRRLGEPDRAWFSRVLRAWGVEDEIVNEEIRRFESWRAASASPGRS